MSQKAVFLDRDGVINIDKGYVWRREDFEWTAGLFDALRAFQSRGYLLIVVTNQSGIARGFYTEEDFAALSRYMVDELSHQGIQITKIYHCPHAPDEGCKCRKPQPKMLTDAAREYDIDMAHSYLIGDKESDIEAALSAGVGTTILIGAEPTRAKYKVKNIYDTIELIF
jgi:D-glycero-D-manno-heptose 1,7-bisphosphate phosphatase